jgi:WD40 repeat protein
VTTRTACLVLCLALLGPGVAGPALEYGDPLPDGARFRRGTVRLQHGGTVLGTAFLPDGRSVASVSADVSLCVWDLKTGKELRRFLAGHQDGELAVREVAPAAAERAAWQRFWADVAATLAKPRDTKR